MASTSQRSHLWPASTCQKHATRDQGSHEQRVHGPHHRQARESSKDDHHPTAHRSTGQAASWSPFPETRESIFALHPMPGIWLARTNEQTFEAFVGETCHSGPIPPAVWRGRVERPQTHTMQRMGMAAECSRSPAKSRIVDGEVLLNKRLRESCSSRSQDLRLMFR